jgi:hypothetical protein
MVSRLGMVPDPTYFTAVEHTEHCFHMIRQSILCNADITPISVGEKNILTKEELHRCRDWTKIRAFVAENQAEWQGIGFTHAWEDMDKERTG